MSTDLPDYQKHLVLFVDDEDKTRKYFKRLFGDTFRIILASDGVEALEVLQQHLDEVGLIVTDQRMPNETGVAFLEKASRLKPSLVRILSTAYADIETAIDSVNKGGVYRYVTKPWDVADFEVTLRRAMEFFMLQTERNSLLKLNASGIEALAMSDRVLSLAALAASRDSGLRRVAEGLTALMSLHGACDKTAAAQPPHVSWPELYRRHHAFLNRAMELLPHGLAGKDTLAKGETLPAESVLEKAVEGNALFSLAKVAGEGARFPGPAAAVTGLVSSLIDGISGALDPDDRVKITNQPGGVEVALPEASIARALEPLFGAADAPPSASAFGLVAAFLRFTDAGGILESIAQPGTGKVKLRLGFEPAPAGEAPKDAFESIAADLIGNELFWARNV